MSDNQPAADQTGAQETPSQLGTQLTGEIPKQVAWEQHIPEAYKDAGFWKNFQGKGLDEVLKSYANAQEYMGSSVRLPKSGDDAEGWQKLYKAIGRPETHDKYTWDPPEITGVDWKNQNLDGYKKKFWELGLNESQVKGILDFNASQLMDETRSDNEQFTQDSAKAEAELKEEYKTNYNFTVALVERYLKTKFGEEGDNASDLLALAKARPEMFKTFAKEAQMMNEAGSFGRVSPGDYGGLTYESAQAKIQEINAAGKDHPYWNHKHPDHQKAYEEMLKYHAVKKPNAA